MKKGFTLVELSIVLVIIGLLVGGILVGQSLIETARINKAIRTIQQYDIAISNFKSKYKSLPGDSRFFTPPGNGNGGIFNNLQGNGLWGDEIANFWPHLQAGGFNYKDKTFAATIAASGFDVKSATPNSPTLDADKLSGIIVAIQTLCSVNCYLFSDWQNKQVTNSAGGSLYTGLAVFKPVNMMAIDSKLDDGRPNAGNLRARGPGLSGADTTCVSAAAYVLTSNNVTCTFTLSILAQVGQGGI